MLLNNLQIDIIFARYIQPEDKQSELTVDIRTGNKIEHTEKNIG